MIWIVKGYDCRAKYCKGSLKRRGWHNLFQKKPYVLKFPISNDNLFIDEHKALKEIQSDTSIVSLLADKDRCIAILNPEDYFKNCMVNINNVYFKKYPPAKVKANTLKQILLLLITPLHLDFMVNQKYKSQELLYVLYFI